MTNASNFFFILIFLVFAQVHSQSFTATVQDVNSGTPIPFATVQLSENQGTITNDEGVFAIDIEQLAQLKDSIRIWSMGYEKVSIFPKKAGDTIISLKVKLNELENTFLTNNPLEPEEIIERVKENLATNYPNSLTKKRIFFRESVSNKMNKMDIEVEKTTIPEFNQSLMDSILQAVPTESQFYSESVGTLSGNYNKQKLSIDRAAKLYDKSKTDVGVNSFGDRLKQIVEKNVKADSYFKIKSGIIGTTIDREDLAAGDDTGEADKGLKIEVNSNDDPSSEDITQSVKDGVNEVYEALFFQEDATLDMIEKSNRYEFTQRKITNIGEDVVYVIGFEPKGRKDFKGSLYVNTEDFAVLRIEYENVRKISSFGMFGISYRKHLNRGKSIFGKDENGGYTLRYMEVENGFRFGLDRPLKIIEKNKNVKGRRKQNEVAMEIEMSNTMYTKQEFVVYDSQIIDERAYKNTSDSKDIKATYLSAYDPEFWKGYTIMEPNTAIQEFRVVK